MQKYKHSVLSLILRIDFKLYENNNKKVIPKKVHFHLFIVLYSLIYGKSQHLYKSLIKHNILQIIRKLYILFLHYTKVYIHAPCSLSHAPYMFQTNFLHSITTNLILPINIFHIKFRICSMQWIPTNVHIGTSKTNIQ